MAHKKGGGSTKNLRDSQPKYLGVKLANGARAETGAVIVRQRGTRYLAGNNVGMGKDHTLFALKSGIVKFAKTSQKRFDRQTLRKNIVHVS